LWGDRKLLLLLPPLLLLLLFELHGTHTPDSFLPLDVLLLSGVQYLFTLDA
jgi:hypothetical protein